MPIFSTQQKRGFAVIDAVVALLVFASSLALTLTASQVARKTALAAAEIRRADTILHYLYERPVDQPGAYSGQIADLAWQIVVSPIPSERADSTLRL